MPDDSTVSGSATGIFAEGGGAVSVYTNDVINQGNMDPTGYGIYAVSTGAGNVTVIDNGSLDPTASGITATSTGGIIVISPGPDITPPVLTSTSPADDAADVPIESNIVLNFDEQVFAGTGNIAIHNASDGSLFKSFAITDATQVHFSTIPFYRNSIVVDPNVALLLGHDYYITIDNGAIHDGSGNVYAGLTSATAYNFTTSATLDTTAPVTTNMSPAGYTNVSTSAPVGLSFDEPVRAGTGNVEIRNADGSLFKSIAITDDSQVTIFGNQVGIYPDVNFADGATYYVVFGSGVINDLAGNPYAGISSPSTFRFTTADINPPQLVSSTPAVNSTRAGIDGNVVLTFNEPVHGGSQFISLVRTTGGAQALWMFAPTDTTHVIFSGNTVTINSGALLTPGTDYYVSLAAYSVLDSAGNGIYGTDVHFSTIFDRGTDFNRDVHSDVLWQSDSGQAAVWLMNGTNLSGGGGVGINPGTSWQVKSGGDFNGDGKADVLWQNTDGTPVIWIMDGMNYASGGAAGPNPGTSWKVIGSGDFDGDRRSDILWQNADGTPAIWLMNGTTMVSGASFANPGTSWHVIGAGDFNGDGKSDILWQSANGQAAIWLMNGTDLIAGGAVGPNPGTAWHLKGAGDFNGDGKSDILWQNDDGTPVIWFVDGVNFTGGGVAGFNPGSNWRVMGSGDFNSDANADILWQNTDGSTAVWLMSSTNLLSGSSIQNPGTSWHVIASSS